MGLLESAGEYFGKATSDVTRKTRLAGINAQISEMEKQRDGALLRLIKSLYPSLSSCEEARREHEALFNCIEDIDFQINRLKYEKNTLQQVDRFSDPARCICPKCGASVQEGDVFCRSCGTKVAGDKTSQQNGGEASCCPKCGAPTETDAAFCTHCGFELRN